MQILQPAQHGNRASRGHRRVFSSAAGSVATSAPAVSPQGVSNNEELRAINISAPLRCQTQLTVYVFLAVEGTHLPNIDKSPSMGSYIIHWDIYDRDSGVL